MVGSFIYLCTVVIITMLLLFLSLLLLLLLNLFLLLLLLPLSLQPLFIVIIIFCLLLSVIFTRFFSLGTLHAWVHVYHCMYVYAYVKLCGLSAEEEQQQSVLRPGDAEAPAFRMSRLRLPMEGRVVQVHSKLSAHVGGKGGEYEYVLQCSRERESAVFFSQSILERNFYFHGSLHIFLCFCCIY